MADLLNKKLKISVDVGQKKLLIPALGSNTVESLIQETTRRYKSLYPGVPVTILSLKTQDGVLFGEDCIADVLNDGASVTAITSDSMDDTPLTVSSSASSTPRTRDPANDPNNNNSSYSTIPSSFGNFSTSQVPVLIPTAMSVTPTTTDAQPPSIPKPKRENTTNYAVEYRTIGGEARQVFDLTEDHTLEDLGDAIVKEEGKDVAQFAPQIYTMNYPLMPIGGSEKMTLKQWGIKNNDLLFVTFIQKNCAPYDPDGWESVFAMTNWWRPEVNQTDEGLSAFLSTLYVVATKMRDNSEHFTRLFANLRKITQFFPLIHALAYLRTRPLMRCNYMPAISNGLYWIFRQIVPATAAKDNQVFEHSRMCWNFLISEYGVKPGQVTDFGQDIFTKVSLRCALSYTSLVDPVKLPGVEDWCSKDEVRKRLAKGEKISGLSDPSFDLGSLDKLQVDESCQRLVIAHPNMTEAFLYQPCEVNMNLYRSKPTMPSLGSSWQAIKTRRALDYLTLIGPLSLKSSTPPVITRRSDGKLAVYTGKAKDAVISAILFNPLTGKSENLDPNQLATDLALLPDIEGTSSTIMDTREPKEATIVLLDVSGSMGTVWSNGLTRMVAVKQLFHAFANRTMAYDYPHHIGLILFGTEVYYRCALTPNFDIFKSHVDAASPGGFTSLYDAMIAAKKHLLDFRKLHKDCLLRVLCLTDGDDTKSTSSAAKAGNELRSTDIIVDSVIIGRETKGAELKAICNYNAGLAFQPDTIEQAVKLFEVETMLSVGERSSSTKGGMSTTWLDSYSDVGRYPFNQSAPKRKQPALINKPVTSAERTLTQAAALPPSSNVEKSTLSRIKRILQELHQFIKSPHPSFHVFPCQENVTFWRMLLEGPTGTPYENGIFLLYAHFPESYPNVAPEVRFITPIYHCNVNADGKVCHSVFDRNWTTSTTMFTVLSCIFGLLLTPEPEDPLDSTLAEEYFANKTQYETKAKQHTTRHATKTLSDWTTELLGHGYQSTSPSAGQQSSSTANNNNPSGPPSHLLCPLTHELFEEAVITPYGHTYDKKAIESWLEQKKSDPLTNKTLKKEELKPNFAIRQAVEEYKKLQELNNTWWNA